MITIKLYDEKGKLIREETKFDHTERVIIPVQLIPDAQRYTYEEDGKGLKGGNLIPVYVL